MTTDELKAVYDAARTVAHDAEKAAKDAKKTWLSALRIDMIADFEAQGGVFAKTRVRLGWRGEAGPDMNTGPYFAVGVSSDYGGVQFDIAVIKRDGTPGMTNRGVYRDRSRVFIVPEDQPEQAQ